MPTLSLTDSVGVEVNAELNEGGALAKYLKGLSQLKLAGFKFADIAKVPLDHAPINSLQTGITFSQPIAVGANSELKIDAGAAGGIKLLSAKDKVLFDPTLYDDPIPINAGQFYVAVDTTAKFSPEFSSSAGDLSFGLSGGASLGFATYRLFEKSGNAEFPLWLDAVKESILNFSIPRELADLQQMSVGSVATVDGSGNLKVAGEVELLSAINPLASLNLPEPMGTLGVSSGGSIKVGASFVISGAFQIRVQKIAADKVRLGVYRQRGTEFSVKAAASLGAAIAVGDFQPLEPILKAISRDPQADFEKLKAQLDQGQVEGIKKAVEEGISRKLELALTLELSSQGSSAAAFLFDVKLNHLDANGKEAIHQALGGDLRKLSTTQNLPGGINLVRSILTEVKKTKHALKFNLLGIYNFISVSSLVLNGRVMFEAATGELVITDTATASRISASSFNFAADGEKLRKVLAETVLISAAYRCSKLVLQQPQLRIAHTAFELHTKTDRTAMKNNLDVFEALGLMSAAEKNEIVSNATQFGRTTLYSETAYDDAVVDRLFLQNGKARPRTDYEKAGRKALALLVQTGEVAQQRRLPATDDLLWKEMREVGQPSFGAIAKLKNLPGPVLGAITADYSAIVWWAESMTELGAALAEVRDFINKNPAADPQAESFKGLRKTLASKLKEVAANTKSEFGDPWGLIAMDQASGQQAAASVRLISPTLAVFRERNP